MPKRTSVRRFETDEVQGEGSFIVLTSLKVKEIRELRKKGRDKDEEGNLKTDPFEDGAKLLAKHIHDWNWVDDNDEPLPVPKGKLSVVDMLTNEECEYISDLLSSTDTKN